MGWGTSHAYMKLSDKLEDEDPPSIIIYTMIPHHVRRNYILKEWVERLNQFDRGHPHFELINGEPVFQGIIDVSDGAEDVPSTRQIELSLTSAFLDQMRTKAKQAKIRFVVIFLEALPPYEVIRGLVKNDVSVLDLTSLELEGFAGDQHPNPQDHERIAEAISRSFVAQILSDQ